MSSIFSSLLPPPHPSSSEFSSAAPFVRVEESPCYLAHSLTSTVDPAEIIPIVVFAFIGSFVLFALLIFCLCSKLPLKKIKKFFKGIDSNRIRVSERISGDQVEAAKEELSKEMPVIDDEHESHAHATEFNLDIAKLWYAVISSVQMLITPDLHHDHIAVYSVLCACIMHS